MTNARPIEILLVEDNQGDVFLTKKAFEKAKINNNIQVAADGEVALEMLRGHGIYENTERPDIVLLDINLPDIDGLELCSDIKKQYSDIKVIGLTSTNEAAIIAGFLQRGGNGYLLKNMERHELLEAIQMVMDGKVYLSKASNDKLLENFHSLQNGGNAIPVLTRREKEIILLIADGLNGPQIAEKLFLSHYTVETHRKNLLKKFNVNNVQQMMKAAREFRLI